MRIILELDKEQERLMRDRLSWYDDEGPRNEGWQSKAMEKLGEQIRNVIDGTFEVGDRITPKDPEHFYYGKIAIVGKFSDNGNLVHTDLTVDHTQQWRKV